MHAMMSMLHISERFCYCLQAISDYVAMLKKLYNSGSSRLILEPFVVSESALHEADNAGAAALATGVVCKPATGWLGS